MKKIILLVCVVMLGIAGIASAQEKMATIDIMRCATTSDAGIAATEELRKMEADLQAKLKPMQDELTKLQEDYMAQEKVLTEAAKKTKMEAIQKKAMELENTARTYNSDLQRREQELMNKVLSELEVIVKDIAAKGGYTVVMTAQAVVFAPNLKDITADVIDAYNKSRVK